VRTGKDRGPPFAAKKSPRFRVVWTANDRLNPAPAARRGQTPPMASFTVSKLSLEVARTPAPEEDQKRAHTGR